MAIHPSANDLDYLGAQGYWVCAAVAVLSFVGLAIAGQPLVGTFVLLFYCLSGRSARTQPLTALPPRWDDTWTDKFADKLPMWLWPKVRILYCILSACYLLLFTLGLAALLRRRIL